MTERKAKQTLVIVVFYFEFYRKMNENDDELPTFCDSAVIILSDFN